MRAQNMRGCACCVHMFYIWKMYINVIMVLKAEKEGVKYTYIWSLPLHPPFSIRVPTYGSGGGMELTSISSFQVSHCRSRLVQCSDQAKSSAAVSAIFVSLCALSSMPMARLPSCSLLCMHHRLLHHRFHHSWGRLLATCHNRIVATSRWQWSREMSPCREMRGGGMDRPC